MVASFNVPAQSLYSPIPVISVDHAASSDAVFGLLLACAMVFPRRIVVPLFPPIPMRAPTFVALHGGLELFLGVTGTQAGVAHFAHLGGMAGGYLLLRYWRGAR
ncbi:MAG: rhomboid family intramembrane serine protease [Betaproteobacteria bacterium]|nr:rhomboid family intramembrane serine protease [Betaproteobacteria bacterium]